MLKLDGQEKYYIIKRSELDEARHHLKRMDLYAENLSRESIELFVNDVVSVLNRIQIGDENREITEEQAIGLLQ